MKNILLMILFFEAFCIPFTGFSNENHYSLAPATKLSKINIFNSDLYETFRNQEEKTRKIFKASDDIQTKTRFVLQNYNKISNAEFSKYINDINTYIKKFHMYRTNKNTPDSK